MRRYTRAYRLYLIAAWHQFIVLTGYATYLSLVPDPGTAFTSVWDKLLHVICWLVLTLSLRLAWPAPRFPLWAALGLLSYSGLIEVLQHFGAEREGSVMDVLSNGLGIAIGYGLVALLWPPLERRLFRSVRDSARR